MIEYQEATKRYGAGPPALDSLSLEVPAGEACVLVGPSGGGKTTALKMVNRLVEPTSGRVLIDGNDVAASDPVALRRGIGYVIQQVGLFPHLDVAANVATVPRLLGWDRAPDRCPRRRAARPRRPRPGDLPAPPARRALRRAAPAGGRGPGPGRRPADPADGRALRRRRSRHPGPAPGRVPSPPAAAPPDGGARHPRHRRGAAARRPPGGAGGRRPARAVRHPGRGPGPPGDAVRGRLRRRRPHPPPPRPPLGRRRPRPQTARRADGADRGSRTPRWPT